MEESSIHQEQKSTTRKSAVWTIGHIIRFIQTAGIIFVFVLLTFGMLGWFGLLDAADTQGTISAIENPNNTQTDLNDALIVEEGQITTLQARAVHAQVDRLASADVEEGQQTDIEPTPTPTAIPTETPLPTVVPSPTREAILEVPATPAPQTNLPSNLRGGPGTVYPIVGSVQTGYPLQIIAKNVDGSWYQLDTKAWIAAFLVDNAAHDIPIAEEIPAPPLTPEG